MIYGGGQMFDSTSPNFATPKTLDGSVKRLNTLSDQGQAVGKGYYGVDLLQIANNLDNPKFLSDLAERAKGAKLADKVLPEVIRNVQQMIQTQINVDLSFAQLQQMMFQGKIKIDKATQRVILAGEKASSVQAKLQGDLAGQRRVAAAKLTADLKFQNDRVNAAMQKLYAEQRMKLSLLSKQTGIDIKYLELAHKQQLRQQHYLNAEKKKQQQLVNIARHGLQGAGNIEGGMLGQIGGYLRGLLG